MNRSATIAGFCVLALAAASGAAFFLRAAPPSHADTDGGGGEPPQTVSTTIARALPWRTHLDAVGDLRAVRGADLSAEVAGIVGDIDFASGANVPAGAVLLRLRLHEEPARLAELRANADLAALNLSRDTRENAAQAVSHAVVDTDQATLAADRAQVAAEQALIDEKIVRAPFAGRLGVRQVDLGQYLQPGTTIVTLQSVDPIFVDFYLPQGELAGIDVGGHAQLTVDTYPGRRFDARIDAIAPRVDQASRTAEIRATLANPDGALLPGMFANVRLETGAPASYVTLPQAAITYATYGSTIFIVRPGPPDTQIAHQVLVQTGETRGDQVAVVSGLSAGETVVTAGQLKLHEGTPLTINNSIAMRDSPDPHPAEE